MRADRVSSEFGRLGPPSSLSSDVRQKSTINVYLNKSNAEILQGYSGVLFDRIEYLESSDESAAEIERGLLFLMAFWSGPAVVGFRNICRVFERDGVPDGFTFRVLNIDGVARPLMIQLSQLCPQIGGNAEGYWFRSRQVFATTICTASDDRIQELIQDAGLL